MVIVSREISRPEIFPQLNIDRDFSEEVTRDIERFVSIRLKELSRINGFTAHLLEHIQQIPLKRAKGTFLWLGPVVNELLRKDTCTEVLETLKSLPVELPTMYGRMLLQIDSHRRDVASQILRWVAMARRPLTLHELAAAIDIKPLPLLNSEQVIRDYISLCESFLTIHKDGKVSLIHQSAKDYMLRGSPDSNPILEQYFRILPEKAHFQLAQTCLAYLQKSDLHTRAVRFQDPPALPVVPLSEEPPRVSDVLRGDNGVVDEKSSHRYLEEFPLLRYAALHWPEHARLSSGCADMLFDPGHPFFQKDSALRRHWWRTYHASSSQKIFEKECDQVSLLHIASFFGIVPWVRKLLENGNQTLESEKGKAGYTELQMAVYGEHAPVVKLLLEDGRKKHFKGRYGEDALNRAMKDRNYDIVQLLLKHGAATCVSSLMIRAVDNGDRKMVDLFLNNGADVNYRFSGDSPLQHAAYRGDDMMAKLLLDHGADIHDENCWGHSASHFAASYSHEMVLKLLLDRGADVNSKSKNGYSALHLAACNGYKMALQLLLDRGADINAVDDFGVTALDLAIQYNHETAARFLLDRGATRGKKTLKKKELMRKMGRE
ncbi:hypothetical protein VTN96DRAFT_726 [Rasamsonia emersonii]